MSKLETDKKDTSDEIDLGQLFNLIGKGFQKVFRAFLRVYLYFKRNLFWFLGLAALGGIVGFMVNKIVGEKQKLEVIVSPNMDHENSLYDTRTYLYDAVSEIQSEIKTKDTAFFKSLGMEEAKMKGFEIEVAPVVSQNQAILQSESGIMEALKEFKESDGISEILKAQLRNKTKKDQRITFFFTEAISGTEYARRIIAYINSNTYYSELVKIQNDNAEKRIQRNDSLVTQIDLLIDNYTERMGREQLGSEGQLILENQEALDVPSLFQLKNQLVRDTEYKRVEIEMNQEPITVINFGKPHKVTKPPFQKNLVFFPLVFIGLFLLISTIKFLNRRAEQLSEQR